MTHDLAGKRFGRLVAKEKIRVVRESGRTVLKWACVCDCGNSCTPTTSDLLSGKQVSCGCYKAERIKTHGMSRTKEYVAYIGMLGRCYNINNCNYPYYGERGIEVCDRWRESFENFLEDIGTKPSDKHSLDRLDVDGNYCPENCRWATQSEQMYNRRPVVEPTYGRVGVTKTKGGRWAASISYNTYNIHLGVFDTFEEAVNERRSAELEYFGFLKE